MEFLPVTWEEIHEKSLELAVKVLESGYRPDVIIGILRGGYIIARIIADALNIDELGIVEVKFYKSVGERAERPIITQPLVIDVRGKKVLIVDDVVESGRTLEIVTEQARLRGAKEVKVAALFFKPRSIIIPDFYAVKTTKWIVFPWELGELFRIYNIRDLQEAKELLRKIGYDVKDKIVDGVIKSIKLENTRSEE